MLGSYTAVIMQQAREETDRRERELAASYKSTDPEVVATAQCQGWTHYWAAQYVSAVRLVAPNPVTPATQAELHRIDNRFGFDPERQCE